MATTIQLKRGLSTNWTTKNPVLADGEVGFETDTQRFKIGDGTTPWNSLGYAPAPDDELSNESEHPVQNKVIKEALEEKVGKPENPVEGHLLATDENGDAVDSGLPSDKTARKDGYYGADGLGAATAENLVFCNAKLPFL